MREIKRGNPGAAACAVLLLCGVADVTADEGINTTFSGYGTVGGALTSDSQYVYRHDPSESRAAAEQFDVGLESRLGLQAVVDFGSGFSVTAQELARRRGSTDFSLGTEWLFVQYSPASDWKFRLGRVALATFLVSDSRYVGYAAPWFNAPNEVYGSEPIESLDGAQALWHKSLGSVGIGLEGSYGTTKADYYIEGADEVLNAKDMYNLAVSLEFADFLFRVAQTDINLPTSIPLTPTLIYSFLLHDKFTSLGMQYDNGTAIVLAEWTRRSENKIPILMEESDELDAWYVAGGWRFGKLTPLVVYSTIKSFASLTVPNEQSNGTWSASLRYDIVRNIALKAQVSRAQASNPNYWLTPNFASNERVNVFSLGADFVF